MKWFALLLFLCALIYPILGQDSEEDFTSRYAELASPVPPNVDVQELVSRIAIPEEDGPAGGS